MILTGVMEIIAEWIVRFAVRTLNMAMTKRRVKMIASPCEDCVHYFEEQIDSGPFFSGALADCEEEAPDGVFLSEWGCMYFTRRKDDE